MKKGKGIPRQHRDLVRPFASRLGDLLDVFHGEVHDLTLPELERLEVAIRAVLVATRGHESGKFHHAAGFLEPMVLDAREHLEDLAEQQAPEIIA